MKKSETTSDPELTPAVSAELAAYYADRRLMWRNLVLIGLCNIGWGVVDLIVVPLTGLRLLELGLPVNIQSSITSANMMALSLFVMYLSWKSDHTVSRIGRRKPYLFLSAPFIIAAIALFPVFDRAEVLWVLVILFITRLFFMDIKASTFPLLSVDCVPKEILARANSVLSIATGIVGFLAMRFAGQLIKIGAWVPFVCGASVMALSTMCAWWIREPPISYPTTERFKLWSTFKVAAQDKRMFWLMAGVAMIRSYILMNGVWVWFWAKETLGLERAEIFQSLSWASLITVVMAYPVGWIIDHFGGFRVVVFFWLAQTGCYAWALQVHGRHGLLILSVATTIIAPLYAAADMMIYKRAPRKDIGSYTSTNSCLRNAYSAILGATAGWSIHAAGNNFVVGFSIGIAMSTVGMIMFLIHWRLTSQSHPVVVEKQLDVPIKAEPLARIDEIPRYRTTTSR